MSERDRSRQGSEVIRRRGPWRGIEDVEFATLTWVAWYNSTRLLEPLGYLPPVEFEEAYYRRQADPAENGSARIDAEPRSQPRMSQIGG